MLLAGKLMKPATNVGIMDVVSRHFVEHSLPVFYLVVRLDCSHRLEDGQILE